MLANGSPKEHNLKCHTIYSRNNTGGYGINLKMKYKRQLGHYVKLDDNSIAIYSELKNADRILSVNGTDVTSESRDSVMKLIEEQKEKVVLLVIDLQCDAYRIMNNINYEDLPTINYEGPHSYASYAQGGYMVRENHLDRAGLVTASKKKYLLRVCDIQNPSIICHVDSQVLANPFERQLVLLDGWLGEVQETHEWIVLIFSDNVRWKLSAKSLCKVLDVVYDREDKPSEVMFYIGQQLRVHTKYREACLFLDGTNKSLVKKTFKIDKEYGDKAMIEKFEIFKMNIKWIRPEDPSKNNVKKPPSNIYGKVLQKLLAYDVAAVGRKFVYTIRSRDHTIDADIYYSSKLNVPPTPAITAKNPDDIKVGTQVEVELIEISSTVDVMWESGEIEANLISSDLRNIETEKEVLAKFIPPDSLISKSRSQESTNLRLFSNWANGSNNKQRVISEDVEIEKEKMRIGRLKADELKKNFIEHSKLMKFCDSINSTETPDVKTFNKPRSSNSSSPTVISCFGDKCRVLDFNKEEIFTNEFVSPVSCMNYDLDLSHLIDIGHGEGFLIFLDHVEQAFGMLTNNYDIPYSKEENKNIADVLFHLLDIGKIYNVTPSEFDRMFKIWEGRCLLQESVGAFIIDDDKNKCLVIKEANNKWGLAKGRRMFGEEMYAAMKRELHEEVGIHCDMADVLPRIIEYDRFRIFVLVGIDVMCKTQYKAEYQGEIQSCD